MIRRPPRSTLFPYTTALPISLRCFGNRCVAKSTRCSPKRRDFRQIKNSIFASSTKSIGQTPTTRCPLKATRSEEHTSELQSHLNLVCRLLLEKKNHFTR